MLVGMKTILLVSALFFASISAYSQATEKGSIKALDDKYGFRNMVFGTDTTAADGMVYAATSGPIRIFNRPDESKTIGGAQVSSIGYCYYKGHLISVIILTEGPDNSKALLAALIAAYGYPTQPNPYIKTYHWRGRSVTMTFSEDALHKGTALMSSVPLTKQKEVDDKAKAQKGTSDL